MGRRAEIERARDALLREHGRVTSGALARRTGLTRQALSHHLTRWIAEGRLVREGRGRGTWYRHPDAHAGPRLQADYALPGLAEESVWDDVRAWVRGHVGAHSPGFDPILMYAVTELVNNAIDHSDADRVWIGGSSRAGRLTLEVRDEGIGAFERLRGMLGLDDHLHALQELIKGKVTTQPERHTGQGLFFTSKMVDRFTLTANGLRWTVDADVEDQAVFQAADEPGTAVSLELSHATDRRAEDVFERYTTDFEFDKTRLVIRLFEHGVRFVSRSEAKRLLHGLERFRVVALDFQGVEGVGQGFVDEVFRVWAKRHAGVQLVAENMNEPVAFMVRRGWKDDPDAGEVRESVGHPYLERVRLDSGVRFGQPVIRGTRIAVAEVVGLLSAGVTREKLARQLGIRVADVEAALAYAAETVARQYGV